MRQYLIDTDRAKLMAMADEGKTLAEVKSALAAFVSPKAIDAWLANSPKISVKFGGKYAEKSDATPKK